MSDAAWLAARLAEVDAAWLTARLAEVDAVAGTVHRRAGDLLTLTAALNIPPPVVAVTRTIPKGKGMAGLAWARGVPVQTCDLKADATGDVRPGAKAVEAGAAVALPVVDAAGILRAVVGIAFRDTIVLDQALIARLEAAAATLPESSP